MPARIRPRITVTVDPDLLAEVDEYVREHAGSDRSQIVEAALYCWHAGVVREALARQHAAPKSPEELEERAAWKRIRAAQAAHAERKRRAPRPERSA